MLGLGGVFLFFFYHHFHWKTFGSLYIWSHFKLLTWEAIVLEYFPGVWALKSGFKCANCQRVTLGKVPHSPPRQSVQAGMPPARTHSTDIYWAPTMGKCWRQGGDLAVPSQVYAHHVSLSDFLHSTYPWNTVCRLVSPRWKVSSMESKGPSGLCIHCLSRATLTPTTQLLSTWDKKQRGRQTRSLQSPGAYILV